MQQQGGWGKLFLSTPSARRATVAAETPKPAKKISIHALCEEGDALVVAGAVAVSISIHALCEEGDVRLSVWSR